MGNLVQAWRCMCFHRPCFPPPTLLLQGANLMLRTPGGEAVLTDYGVGRIANAGVDVALYTGDAKGTMLYLAPELIGGGKANTFASDVCVGGARHYTVANTLRQLFLPRPQLAASPTA